MQMTNNQAGEAYSRRVRPLYEETKSVFVQVGGFLILRCASLRTRIEMSDRMRDARETLDATRAQLTRIAPPRRYARVHADLIMAADGLDRVLSEVMAVRGAQNQATEIAEQTLRRAYAAFKRASVCELGLHTVDLNCSCCALSA